MHHRAYTTTLLAALLALLAFALPALAADKTTGGASYEPPPKKAKIVNGKAIAPANAPEKVKKVIAAANKIIKKPYKYGGGHAKWNDSGYDCSGTVSFALHGAKLLDSPMPSGSFMSWGRSGPGKWITVYANGGHAFMVVAGLRLDTGYRTSYAAKHGAKSGSGPRWDKLRATDGFAVRHPG
jgi:cell wall-associated NlpC family hydrolase